MKTVSTGHFDQNGKPIMRNIMPAVDRWRKRLWIDVERWNAGKVMLSAFNEDGSQRWEPGFEGLLAVVYHRANLIEVTP